MQESERPLRKRLAYLEGGRSVLWPPCTQPPLGTRFWAYEGDAKQTPLTPEQLAEVKAREQNKPSGRRRSGQKRLFEDPPP